MERDGGLTHTQHQLLDTDLFAVEVLLSENVVKIGNRFNQFIPILLSLRLHRVRNWHGGRLHAEGIVSGLFETIGHILHQIDQTRKVLLGTDWKVKRVSVGLQFGPNIVNTTEEIRADAIHLVDERDPRNPVFVGLAPYGLGLRLNSRNCIKHRDSTVKNTQGAFYFCGKINVPRGINDIDPLLDPFPWAPRSVPCT